MPLFRIQHITKYEYDRLIQESINEIRIFPIESSDQEVLQQDLMITDNPELQIFFTITGEIKPELSIYCLRTTNWS